MDKPINARKKLLEIYAPFVYIIIILFIASSMLQGNLFNPILTTNFGDFVKHPLPPYRDAIARSIGKAAIYFSIIEGATPYKAKINAPESFVQLSEEWYAGYFLLGRKLILNCELSRCPYSIVEAPSIIEATDSSKLYPFKIVQR